MGFLDDDFLLYSDAARRLYHDHAEPQPIYDYHCHLPPADLAADRAFGNLHEAWLEGDHYKWRAMRADGVDERLITGDAEPFEKFAAYAATVPHTLGNPLYHWTHLELRRYFRIDTLLSADTAREVWDEANRQLAQLPVSSILQRFNVALIGTTDDPTDDLKHHKTLGKAGFENTAVYPAFRPDKAHALDDLGAWNGYVDRLAKTSDTRCDTFDGFLDALNQRHKAFHKRGSRLSDHGLTHLPAVSCREKQAKQIFKMARDGVKLSAADRDRFTAFLMLFFGRLNRKRGWTMQLHLGAMRNNNGWALRELGPDTGFDSIGDYPQGPGLAALLGELAARGDLPRTVLYNLNPADNHLFATMAGNFNGGPTGAASEPGKMQFGSGWWFLDQKDGMTEQMRTLANLGLLPRFVGMLTDSRSFLSYPRHEYFRRVLCGLLGDDVERGELPADFGLLGQTIEDICFNNAKRYFGMELKGRHA